ncbi:hypothetical protein NE865_15951 [Phthorimaea operculella]|nr:hypothetical protein NE865_15951 [Phthorimaea operculella]
MKVYIICTCLAIWAFDLALRSNDHSGVVQAQNWDVSKTFKPIEFEWTHRGSFNMSYCSKQMINCFEIFEIQIGCGYFTKRSAVCDAMSAHCHDAYGDDVGTHNFFLTGAK